MDNLQARKTKMTTIDVVAISVTQAFDYGHIHDQSCRDWAMAAAGTIRSNLGEAVVKVIEAGRLLQSAKEKLPHGLYLPWVEQQCGLKPDYAARLVKAVEWINVVPAPHFDAVDSVTTLFLLSADTTPEDVREWFMERAAAGDVPTRAEVAERKRQAAGKPPTPRPVELQALALVRKDQLSNVEAALSLARSITTINEAQVREEIGLRELPKGKVLNGNAADFHRRPDGINWDRIPHAGRADVALVEPMADPTPTGEQFTLNGSFEILSREAASQRLGMTPATLQTKLVPSKNPDGLVRNGYRATRAGRGLFKLEVIP
jgi:hypothetical protein